MAVTEGEGLEAWLRLDQTAGVGPETARKLLAAFGLPDNIFTAGFSALRKVVSERVALALASSPSEQTQALIARTLDWVKQPGNRMLTLADGEYPALLLDIPDPPMILYVKGRLELLATSCIAVVGSRNATAQGIANADKFSEALSLAGLTTVSGMALGIDSAAHIGSLHAFKQQANAGSTIAVIGTGIDIVYPARNRDLAHRIAADGCLVSEYPLGMPAIASNFPRRNRIISGLTRGTLVVEAAAQSGSLITARLAAEQGREVFAIPGSIHSPLSKGCHQLIKSGAKLVESAQDILEELAPIMRSGGRPVSSSANPQRNKSANQPQDQSQNRSQNRLPNQPTTHAQSEHDTPLLAAMGFDPVDIDTLSLRSGLDAAALGAQLLTLEMTGAIEMLPGGIYRRLA